MSNEIVRTDFVVNDSQAGAAMGRMVAGTDRLKSAFGGVLARAATLGTTILGVVGAQRTIAGLDRQYQSVARIKSITGIAAKEAHALSDALGGAGVEASSAERFIMGMARKSAQLGKGTKEAKAMAAAYKRMGIDIEAGPTEKFLQMSAAVKSGRLDVVGLTSLFGASTREAADLMTALSKGPAELKSMMDAQLKSADLIDDKALKTWQSMQQAKRNLSDAWGTVAGAFYKTIVPVVTKFLTAFAENLETWAPAAERFGTFLVDHMSEAVTLAKVFAVTMGAVKLAGGVGNIKAGAGAIGSFAGRMFAGGGAPSAAAQAAGMVSRASAGMVGLGSVGQMARLGRGGMAARAALNAGRVASFGFSTAAIGGPGGGAASLFAVLSKIPSFLGGIGKLSIIGVIIGGVVKAFAMLATNAGGVRDRIGGLLRDIGSKFGDIVVKLKPLWTVFDKVSNVVGKVLVGGVEMLLNVVSGLMPVIDLIATGIGNLGKLAQWLISLIPDLGAGGLTAKARQGVINSGYVIDPKTGKPVKAENFAAVQVRHAQRAVRHANGDAFRSMGGAMAGALAVQHFTQNIMPGAHVTVTQDFAPGFDPDKVKLAMLSEITAAGERRLMSGVVPSPFMGRR